MSYIGRLRSKLHLFSKKITTWYFLAFVICCLIYYNYIKINFYPNEIILRSYEKLTHKKQNLKNVTHDFKKTKAKKRNEQKFILFWSNRETDTYPDRELPFPDEVKKSNCLKTNCHFTNNRTYFGGSLKRFDAVVFYGFEGLDQLPLKRNKLPHERSSHQKYIFFNTESAHYYPINNSFYDGYFNWTATYRLDSDIVLNYFKIKTIHGDVVGPKMDMKWRNLNEEVNDGFKIKLGSKKFAAAWFVSNCHSKSHREGIVSNLREELKKYNLSLHIYGKCGKNKCPLSEKDKCNAIVERDYYFYLSFENSFDKDYVTEKVVTAFQNNAVPVVYGGANYSRFLPPGSYLDARKMPVKNLASLMASLIQQPNLYYKYFNWKRYYTYELREYQFLCELCSVLQDEKFEKYSSHEDFLNWWNNKNLN